MAQPIDHIIAALDDAIALLEDVAPLKPALPALGQSPATLLDQCLTLCAQQEAFKTEPIRTVHHFACTGGTLICKCIAAMPNTQLLSEVDPLSTLMDKASPRFAPTDVATLMRQSTRGASPSLIVELFLNDLETIYRDAVAKGQRLIIRDHAHSHFCVGSEVPARPSLHSMISSKFAAASVITVRHPVDSFLSLKANGWVNFQPANFEEYCSRYQAFIDSHRPLPLVRYEDFVESPKETMSRMCSILNLPFAEHFQDLFGVFKLTGDSGRAGTVIEKRPRRAVDATFVEEVRLASSYPALLNMLGYEDDTSIGVQP